MERTDATAPKDFQAWTGGISNLVKASRAVRGLDRSGLESVGERPSVSVFLVRGEPLNEDLKRVEPVIDVGPADLAKQGRAGQE